MMAEEDAHVRRKIPAFFFLNISKQFISSFHSKNDSQGKLQLDSKEPMLGDRQPGANSGSVADPLCDTGQLTFQPQASVGLSIKQQQ